MNQRETQTQFVPLSPRVIEMSEADYSTERKKHHKRLDSVSPKNAQELLTARLDKETDRGAGQGENGGSSKLVFHSRYPTLMERKESTTQG